MKNLEVKAYRRSNVGLGFLKFEEILDQTDTYFKTHDGSRLKLREEEGREAYAIHYVRADEAKERISKYEVCPIPDPAAFHTVFGWALEKEMVVKKERSLYFYENARIHLDKVEGLDTPFIEIEVVIKTKEEEESAQEIMDHLLELLNIKSEDMLSLGYRELLMNQLTQ